MYTSIIPIWTVKEGFGFFFSHSHGAEALNSLAWLLSCQQYTFTQDFTKSGISLLPLSSDFSIIAPTLINQSFLINKCFIFPHEPKFHKPKFLSSCTIAPTSCTTLTCYFSEQKYNSLSLISVAYMNTRTEPPTKAQTIYQWPEPLRKMHFSITNCSSAKSGAAWVSLTPILKQFLALCKYCTD